MSPRKYLSWKTKCAAALLCVRYDPPIPYDDAKQMTEDQFLSLFQWDHNILHESKQEDRDEYWNLTPMLIKAHRSKTKKDLKTIAKGKRIRAAWENAPLGAGNRALISMADSISAGLRTELRRNPDLYSDGWKRIWGKRKIRSRGFDKTRRRKMSGKVVK